MCSDARTPAQPLAVTQDCAQEMTRAARSRDAKHQATRQVRRAKRDARARSAVNRDVAARQSKTRGRAARLSPSGRRDSAPVTARAVRPGKRYEQFRPATQKRGGEQKRDAETCGPTERGDAGFGASHGETVRRRKNCGAAKRPNVSGEIGWDARIRTPIACSRGRCPTVERRPSAEEQRVVPTGNSIIPPHARTGRSRPQILPDTRLRPAVHWRDMFEKNAQPVRKPLPFVFGLLGAVADRRMPVQRRFDLQDRSARRSRHRRYVGGCRWPADHAR